MEQESLKMDDIGYESGLPPEKEGLLDSYTERELGMLTSFDNMVRVANAVEERIFNGMQYEYWWQPENKQQRKELMFSESPSLVHIIRMTAFNQYLDFMHTPHMKEAADQLLHGIKEEQRLAKEFEVAELTHLFEL